MTKRSAKTAAPQKGAGQVSPTPPADIVCAWHARAFDALHARFIAQTAPHALLITGPQGIGKRAFAEALAARCLGAGVRTPRDLAANPDFRAMGLTDGGKQIVVDQVRELGSFVSLTAVGGGYRFVLVEPAEAMNINAQNALLKTLEEPPPSAVIVLVSALPGRLLPTIRSRCQRIVLQPPPKAAAIEWLAGFGAADADLSLALDLAHGAPRLAATYLDPDWISEVRKIRSTLKAVIAGQAGPLEVALTLEKHLDSLPVFELAYHIVAQQIRQTLAPATEPARPENPIETIRPGTPPLDSRKPFAALDGILAAREMMRQGRAVRARGLLEEILQAMAGLHDSQRPPIDGHTSARRSI